MNDNNLLKQLESAMSCEYELYEKLLHLSKEQFDLLQLNNPKVERIAEIMNQKIEVMEALQKLQNQHESIKERWKVSYSTYTHEERQIIASQRDETMKIIEELKNLEDQIAFNLVHCGQEVNRQLQSLNKGRQATRAYFKADSMPPRFIDKKK